MVHVQQFGKSIQVSTNKVNETAQTVDAVQGYFSSNPVVKKF